MLVILPFRLLHVVHCDYLLADYLLADTAQNIAQVFSPIGENGFPARLYNKLTGELNRSVATYWRDNYDLGYIMRRDWAMLGPKLKGRLHLFVGGSDTFYLTNAVMDVRDFLKQATEPAAEAEIVIGAHDGLGYEHCFRGFDAGLNPDGTPQPNSLTRLT